ncbi:MAG: SRPBCC family protein [Actinomycetota bacterium]
MTVLRETIQIAQPPDEAFDAVADFSSSAGWDPGVMSAERIQEGRGDPSGVGARYRLEVSFRGSRSEMSYVTTEYERPTRVVLEGEGPRLTARDTIGFEATADGGTRILYEADLRLKGVAKLAAPALKGAFGEMGRKALAGMQTWFAQRA